MEQQAVCFLDSLDSPGTATGMHHCAGPLDVSLGAKEAAVVGIVILHGRRICCLCWMLLLDSVGTWFWGNC